jgi:hypothetical protein
MHRDPSRRRNDDERLLRRRLRRQVGLRGVDLDAVRDHEHDYNVNATAAPDVEHRDR